MKVVKMGRIEMQDAVPNVGSQNMTMHIMLTLGKSVNALVARKDSYGKNDCCNTPHWKHTTESEFEIANVSKLPRVDILYAYADMSADLLDASVASGARGIVIAGVGNGNMNRASLQAAARAAKNGTVVVRSSRVATGSVGRNVEVDDDEMNLVASDELNPQKARILLLLALLKPRTTADIQNLFYTY